MPEVRIRLADDNQIRIDLSDDGFVMLNSVAEKRGISLAEMIAEALRLEKLLANRELFVRDKGSVRELVSA